MSWANIRRTSINNAFKIRTFLKGTLTSWKVVKRVEGPIWCSITSNFARVKIEVNAAQRIYWRSVEIEKGQRSSTKHEFTSTQDSEIIQEKYLKVKPTPQQNQIYFNNIQRNNKINSSQMLIFQIQQRKSQNKSRSKANVRSN